MLLRWLMGLMIVFGALTSVAANKGKSPFELDSVTYGSVYENEWVCKKVPDIKTHCGFYRECDSYRCKDVPGCYKVGTFKQQCGWELVHKIKPVPGSGRR